MGWEGGVRRGEVGGNWQGVKEGIGRVGWEGGNQKAEEGQKRDNRSEQMKI